MPLDAEEVQIKLAILEDRQKRTDDIGLSVIAKLESIQRDVTMLRDDHRDQIDRLHDRITAEKKVAHDEIWNAVRHHEKFAQDTLREVNERFDKVNIRVDNGRNWMMSALASGLIGVGVAVLTAIFNLQHVAAGPH